jgi:hypothetical protein
MLMRLCPQTGQKYVLRDGYCSVQAYIIRESQMEFCDLKSQYQGDKSRN